MQVMHTFWSYAVVCWVLVTVIQTVLTVLLFAAGLQEYQITSVSLALLRKGFGAKSTFTDLWDLLCSPHEATATGGPA